MTGSDLDSTVYNNWASMLSKLFVTPTQEILKIAQKYRDADNERKLVDNSSNKI